MKVILLKDIKGVGQRNTVKEIADGHALNYLIPRGLAEQATPAKLAKLQAHMKVHAEVAERHDQQDASHIAVLKSSTITIQAKANEQGHLYRQISPEILAHEILSQTKIDVAAKSITLKNPIKLAGESSAVVTLGSHHTEIRVVIKAA